MAVLPDYVTGTITLANGSTTVTGTGTMFATAAFRPGDTLQIQNLTAIIASVDSNTSLTLTEPWTGTSLIDAPYRARYLPDGARVTAQTTTLIELLGNGVLSNIASVPVEDGNLLVGNAAGQYEAISKDELGIQDPNGSLGKLAALTLAARQILQTDAAGDLKQVALAANKALATDGNGDVTPIDLGTLGRDLLSLSTGTDKQFIRGDGTLGGEVFGTATNGGVIWPNGEIEQWGFVGSLDSGGGAVITYPRAFSEISIFIPVILTDWVSGTFAPLIYQDWAWGNNRLTSQTVWCRRADTGGPLLVGNIRWYARGKA